MRPSTPASAGRYRPFADVAIARRYESAPTAPWQRLPFLNRTLSAGVPIPPLDVEIAA